MMEITSEEQNKVKRMKRLRTVPETSGQYQIHQHLNNRGPRKRREKERVWENFWKDYSWKFPEHGNGNSQSCPRGTKSSIQDKPKEKHAKKNTNQTNKD